MFAKRSPYPIAPMLARLVLPSDLFSHDTLPPPLRDPRRNLLLLEVRQLTGFPPQAKEAVLDGVGGYGEDSLERQSQ